MQKQINATHHLACSLLSHTLNSLLGASRMFHSKGFRYPDYGKSLYLPDHELALSSLCLPLTPQLLKSHYQVFLKICLSHQPLPPYLFFPAIPLLLGSVFSQFKNPVWPGRQSSEGKGREERAGKFRTFFSGRQGAEGVSLTCNFCPNSALTFSFL